MKRPELCYCAVCGGVILPVDTAVEVDGNWECAICNEPCADSICDDDEDDSRPDAEQMFNDFVDFQRGVKRPARDPRDELDGGVR
jgi:hypothetical protein